MILFSKSSADGITAEIAIIQSVIDDSLNIVSPPPYTYIIPYIRYKVKKEMKEFIDKSKKFSISRIDVYWSIYNSQLDFQIFWDINLNKI